MRPDPEHTHRPGDVSDLLLAQILKGEIELIADVIAYIQLTQMPPGSANASSRAATLTPSPKMSCSSTTAPVLDPGRGRTKKGYFWALARDDRPWQGGAPPAVVYSYAPGRGGDYAAALQKGYSGVLQTDAYAGYRSLADPKRAGGPVTLALCRVGGGVAIPAPHRPGRADFPHPVLRAQASLTGRRIGGRSRLAAVDIDRAWPGSVSTADGCGVRVGRAISSRSAGAGGGTSEPAGRFP